MVALGASGGRHGPGGGERVGRNDVAELLLWPSLHVEEAGDERVLDVVRRREVAHDVEHPSVEHVEVRVEEVVVHCKVWEAVEETLRHLELARVLLRSVVVHEMHEARPELLAANVLGSLVLVRLPVGRPLLQQHCSATVVHPMLVGHLLHEAGVHHQVAAQHHKVLLDQVPGLQHRLRRADLAVRRHPVQRKAAAVLALQVGGEHVAVRLVEHHDRLGEAALLEHLQLVRNERPVGHRQEDLGQAAVAERIHARGARLAVSRQHHCLEVCHLSPVPLSHSALSLSLSLFLAELSYNWSLSLPTSLARAALALGGGTAAAAGGLALALAGGGATAALAAALALGGGGGVAGGLACLGGALAGAAAGLLVAALPLAAPSRLGLAALVAAAVVLALLAPARGRALG
mmetsp:Transcript_18233/g.70476  ORF Transcript_18233/g.70476 Transcript_18233/m.70476 type:complete len:404 (-) Transcript_18233:2531-3742(-)